MATTLFGWACVVAMYLGFGTAIVVGGCLLVSYVRLRRIRQEHLSDPRHTSSSPFSATVDRGEAEAIAMPKPNPLRDMMTQAEEGRKEAQDAMLERGKEPSVEIPFSAVFSDTETPCVTCGHLSAQHSDIGACEHRACGCTTFEDECE